MFYKYRNNELFEFDSVSLEKRSKKKNEPEHLDVLYPNGRPIDNAKVKDLMSLLPYIPPIFHNYRYYKNLKGHPLTVDDGLVAPDSDDDN